VTRPRPAPRPRPAQPAPKPSRERKSLGGFGERVAAAHLESKGYRIIERNFRVFEAEIDLIARGADALVFVEVRTRRGAYPGMAVLSVTPRKQRQLLRAVEHYAERHPDIADAPLRIDVITVDLRRDGTLDELTHYEDAVRP
jgi:putative endonuclease